MLERDGLDSTSVSINPKAVKIFQPLCMYMISEWCLVDNRFVGGFSTSIRKYVMLGNNNPLWREGGDYSVMQRRL